MAVRLSGREEATTGRRGGAGGEREEGEEEVCGGFYPVLVPGWMGGIGSTMTITGGGAGSHLCGRSIQEQC